MTSVPRISPLNHLEDGEVRLELTPGDRHRNELGAVHGAVVTALLDGAMGRAIGRRLAAGETCATVQLSVQFLAPAEGELHALSRTLRVGRTVAFLEAECRRSDGTLVASAHGTWALRRAR
jgi:uncharacterized protein (TIGR00369 family)